MADLVNQKKIFEHISKAADSIGEIALDSIPGGAVIKAIWNYGSELQTSRSLKFLEDFQRVLEEKLGRNFYDIELQNQDFHDLFYIVMQEVQKTSSEEKIKRFKNILLNQVTKQEKGKGLVFKYVNLVNNLADIQIIILNKMRNDSSGIFSDMRLAIIPGPTLKETKEHEKIWVKVDNYEEDFIKADLMLFCNELVSLGLVSESLKTVTHHGGKTYKRYSISLAGAAFLNFIESKK